MNRKDFIKDYLSKGENKAGLYAAPEKTAVIAPVDNKVAYTVADQVEKDIETVIARIEMANADITSNYADWLKVGLALANQLG